MVCQFWFEATSRKYNQQFQGVHWHHSVLNKVFLLHYIYLLAQKDTSVIRTFCFFPKIKESVATQRFNRRRKCRYSKKKWEKEAFHIVHPFLLHVLFFQKNKFMCVYIENGMLCQYQYRKPTAKKKPIIYTHIHTNIKECCSFSLETETYMYM